MRSGITEVIFLLGSRIADSIVEPDTFPALFLDFVWPHAAAAVGALLDFVGALNKWLADGCVSSDTLKISDCIGLAGLALAGALSAAGAIAQKKPSSPTGCLSRHREDARHRAGHLQGVANDGHRRHRGRVQIHPLNPKTELSGKVKKLIGLATAAQVPCTYCVYFRQDQRHDRRRNPGCHRQSRQPRKSFPLYVHTHCVSPDLH